MHGADQGERDSYKGLKRKEFLQEKAQQCRGQLEERG